MTGCQTASPVFIGKRAATDVRWTQKSASFPAMSRLSFKILWLNRRRSELTDLSQDDTKYNRQYCGKEPLFLVCFCGLISFASFLVTSSCSCRSKSVAESMPERASQLGQDEIESYQRRCGKVVIDDVRCGFVDCFRKYFFWLRIFQSDWSRSVAVDAKGTIPMWGKMTPNITNITLINDSLFHNVWEYAGCGLFFRALTFQIWSDRFLSASQVESETPNSKEVTF